MSANGGGPRLFRHTTDPMTRSPFKSFSILRRQHIALLWLGQLLSAFGDRFFEIAIVWLSVEIVGSEVGYVLASGSVMRLVVGLLGGVYADRWDRQWTMIVVDIVRALVIFTVPIAAIFAEITLLHLTIVAALEGSLSSIFDPALQASLPTLANDTATLQGTNALLDVTSRMARIFAPGLAGLLIAVLPVPQYFTLDGITFIFSAAAIAALGRKYAWKPGVVSDQHGLQGIIQDIRGALVLVNQRRPVLWSMLSYVPANLVWAGVVMVGLALYSDEIINEGVRGYSFLIAAYGIGSVLSNIIVGGLVVKKRTRFLFAGLIVFGSGILIVGMSNLFAVALIGMFVAAVGTPMSDLLILIMIQEEFPANQVGKVYSLRLTISSLGYSLGLLLAAWVFQIMPIQVGIVMYASLAILVGIAGFIRFRRPEQAQPISDVTTS